MRRPEADIAVTPSLVRQLLSRQHPDLADFAIETLDPGWDNAMFRLGDELAVRLPRRAMAAALVEHEQRWLPQLRPVLPIAVPVPLRIGRPDAGYPWTWSIVPWLEGETAAQCEPAAGQARAWAEFLMALHVAAPGDAPHNPVRGVPLAQRAEKFRECATALAARGEPIDPALRRIWDEALDAAPETKMTWIHGDLHPLNVLVRDGRISGVIDWGDVASGDRATDLASLWLLLPQVESRAEVMQLYTDAAPATWSRARGWALLLASIVLAAGDAQLRLPAQRTLARLREGP
jgi:aminoglycoside phosphotransferase (APT) family kinase protein